jgi:hypothetical protein
MMGSIPRLVRTFDKFSKIPIKKCANSILFLSVSSRSHSVIRIVKRKFA